MHSLESHDYVPIYLSSMKHLFGKDEAALQHEKIFGANGYECNFYTEIPPQFEIDNNNNNNSNNSNSSSNNSNNNSSNNN